MTVGADLARVVSTLRASILADDRRCAEHRAVIDEIVATPERAHDALSAFAGLFTGTVAALAQATHTPEDELLDQILLDTIDYGDGP